MFENEIKEAKTGFEKAINHFVEELASLRTGRANPALLSTVMVESYGATVPLNHVANITTTDAKTLSITPWDKSQIGEVEKGILAANIGVNPSNDGLTIRLNFPPMTTQRRGEMVKLLGQMAERTRINLRNVREDALKSAKRLEGTDGITKDNLAEVNSRIQKLIDTYNAEIKKLVDEKEAELMTV